MIVLVLVLMLFAIWIASIITFFFAMPYASFLLPGSRVFSILAFLNIFVAIGIPFLAIVLRAVRFLFKRQVLSPRWKMGMWSFYVLNIISLFAVASFTGRQFSEGQQESQTIAIENAGSTDTLHMELLDNISNDGLIQIGDVTLSDLKLLDENVHLSILKSKDGKFELEQRRYSRGQNNEEALLLANEINYSIEQRANTLTFPEGFVIDRNGKWRGQAVELTLRIPEGQYVTIDRRLTRIINDVAVQENNINPWQYQSRVWKMGSEGLICSECPESKMGDEQFSYNDYHTLQIEGEMKVDIEQGENYNIRLTGKEVYTRKVEMVQTGNLLTINADFDDPQTPVRLYITLPFLKSLDLENTGDVKLSGFTQTAMSIKCESDHDLKAYLTIDSLHLQQRENSDVDLWGSGKYLKAKLSDRTRLDAEHYTVAVADVSTEHSGKALLSVTDTLRRNSNNGSDRIQSDVDPKIVIDSQ